VIILTPLLTGLQRPKETIMDKQQNAAASEGTSSTTGSVFTLEPNRMTQKWLRNRTIDELKQLLVRWPEPCCRGRQIQTEIELREEKPNSGLDGK
jgi:hypothetical protein